MSASVDEEEFVPEDETDLGPALVKKLREKLQKAVEEKQEYLEGWQRARADFANFKKEEALIHGDREARIKSELIEELIPALDTFEMALKHSEDPTLQIVHKQLLDTLKRMGVEKFGKAGDAFDPYRYEALREVTTDEQAKDHTVESVERSGYTVSDKIIRPAQVSVYSHK